MDGRRAATSSIIAPPAAAAVVSSRHFPGRETIGERDGEWEKGGGGHTKKAEWDILISSISLTHPLSVSLVHTYTRTHARAHFLVIFIYVVWMDGWLDALHCFFVIAHACVDSP